MNTGVDIDIMFFVGVYWYTLQYYTNTSTIDNIGGTIDYTICIIYTINNYTTQMVYLIEYIIQLVYTMDNAIQIEYFKVFFQVYLV